MNIKTSLVLAVTALSALGFGAARPAAAQSTIYSCQADLEGRGATYTGQGAASTDPNFVESTFIGFQRMTEPTGGLNPIVFSNNTEGAATFSYKTGSYFTGSGTANTPEALLSNFDHVGNTTDGQMSMIGLAANTPFTAYFYGTNGPYSGQGNGTKFTLTNSSYTTPGVSASTINNQDLIFILGENYVTLTGTTDASGSIYATYQAGIGNEGDFNGAQFVVGSAAPEPSQWAGLVITAFGALGLIMKARRKIVIA